MTIGRHSYTIIAFAVGWLGLLLVASGCRRHSDAALQERLVGTWRYAGSEGNQAIVSSDLAFTITTNGDYISQITIPRAHSLKGIAAIKNGFLMVTVTSRDNTNVAPPMVERQTIVRFDEKELVTKSEGSNVKNRFRNLQRMVDDDLNSNLPRL